jgi:hypothetical protein
VDDLIPAFRSAAIQLVEKYQAQPLVADDLATLLAAQSNLVNRRKRFESARDGREIWQEIFSDPARVPDMTIDEFNQQMSVTS